MPANRPAPKWLDRTLFLTNHHFTLCTTEEQFHKVCRRLKLKKADYPPFMKTPMADATVHTFVTPDGAACAVVCLKHDPHRAQTTVFGLLVHEAVHIWQHTCEDLGEAHPSKEFEAYAIQSMSQRLMEEYVRQTTPC